MYRKPWTIKVPVNFVPDDDLIEQVCLENEKDRGRLVGRLADERKTEKKIPVAVLAQYEGTYDVGPLGNWKVAIIGDNLTVDLGTGGGKQVMFARADDVFVLPSAGGTVTFVKDAKNVVTHLFLTIVEGDFKAERKKTP